MSLILGEGICCATPLSRAAHRPPRRSLPQDEQKTRVLLYDGLTQIGGGTHLNTLSPGEDETKRRLPPHPPGPSLPSPPPTPLPLILEEARVDSA